MKKIIFALLITLNIFAMSETPTNQNKNTQCKHKAFYENKYEIDRIIASDKPPVKIDESSAIRR